MAGSKKGVKHKKHKPRPDKKTYSAGRVLFVRSIPARIKNLFKATAARREDNMSEVICSLMKAYILEPDKFVIERKERYHDGFGWHWGYSQERILSSEPGVLELPEQALEEFLPLPEKVRQPKKLT